MVLARLVGELRLEEELAARYDAGAVGGRETLADTGLVVVAALVRGVDTPEAGAERELGQGRGPVFLPGGAIEEVRGHPALGATETPRAPVRSIARATSPEAFASSTTPRR